MNKPVLLALILMLVLVAISLYGSGKDIMCDWTACKLCSHCSMFVAL